MIDAVAAGADVPLLVLQTCEQYVGSDGFRYADMMEPLADMALRDAFLCTIKYAVGLTAASLIFWFAISAFISWRASPTIAIILAVLIGPLALAAAPASAIGWLYAILLFAGGVIPAGIVWRLSV